MELAFRPHAVALGEAAAGRELQLEGSVDAAEFLGEFVRYEIRVKDAIVIADQPHARGQDRLAKGTAVRLGVPAAEIRLIG
jgi:iron(III) transport system ATP-binding protein